MDKSIVTIGIRIIGDWQFAEDNWSASSSTEDEQFDPVTVPVPIPPDNFFRTLSTASTSMLFLPRFFSQMCSLIKFNMLFFGLLYRIIFTNREKVIETVTVRLFRYWGTDWPRLSENKVSCTISNSVLVFKILKEINFCSTLTSRFYICHGLLRKKGLDEDLDYFIGIDISWIKK